MDPHLQIASFALHGALLAAAAKKSSSPASSLIIIVVLFAAAYFLLIRPQRNRARRAQQTQQTIEIGDEVMLTSGIIGRVRWLEGDRARIEISDGVEVEVLRAAIARQVPATVPEDETTSSEPPLVDGSHPDEAPSAEGWDHTSAESNGAGAGGAELGGRDDGDVKEGS